MTKLVVIGVIMLAVVAGGAVLQGKTKPAFRCCFSREAWDPSRWIMVKSPRWDHLGTWIQGEVFIQNETPADAKPEDLLGSRAAETYTSMVLKKKFGPDLTVRAKMEFKQRMAPLIVIAPELGHDEKDRPEYREHYEIVIYDKGLNIWYHNFKDGKPWWKKIADSRFTLKPNTRYDLTVEIKKNAHGKMISISIDGHQVGILRESFPDEFHVGITGCEGENRFYDFEVVK